MLAFGVGAIMVDGLAYKLLKEEQKKSVDREIKLVVGDKYIIPSSSVMLQYSGMPDPQRFLLSREDIGGFLIRDVANPLYYQSDTKQIIIDGHQLSIVKVSPEELILKYLGHQ